MLRRTSLAAGLLMLGLNSFAIAAPPPLPSPIAPALPVEVVLNQQELGVDVSDVAGAVGAQFGLIGALIGSAVQNEQAKKAEAAVIPLRNMLLEYAFDQHMEQALRAKLASEGISPDPHVTVLKTPWDAWDAQHAQDVPLEAMVIIPHYSVDSSFRQATVQLTVQVVDRTLKDGGKIKTKYRFSRLYAFRFPLVEEKGVANLDRWQSIGKERFAAMLDEGINQVSDMLVFDMSTQGRAQWPMDGKAETVVVRDQKLVGHPVRQTPTVAWVRAGWSRVQNLSGIEPVSEQDPATAIPESTFAPGAASAGVSTTPVAPPSPATPAMASGTTAPVPVATPVVVPTGTASPVAPSAPAAATPSVTPPTEATHPDASNPNDAHGH